MADARQNSTTLPQWRKSLRNARINYCNGWFFATTQVARNKCILGAIVAGRCSLTPLGEAVRDYWLSMPSKHPELELDEFVVMPNHFHAILRIHFRPTNKEHHLGYLMSRFKGGTGYIYGKMLDAGRAPSIEASQKGASAPVGGATNGRTRHLWQFDYWDDLITSAEELNNQRHYIRNNPGNWTRDRFGPCTQYSFGNLELLSAPRIAFVASQGFSASALHPKRFGAKASRAGMERSVLISTFTSAQEREALRRALAKGRRVIAVCPAGLPPASSMHIASAGAIPQFADIGSAGAMPQIANIGSAGAMPQFATIGAAGAMHQFADIAAAGAMHQIADIGAAGAMYQFADVVSAGVTPQFADIGAAGFSPQLLAACREGRALLLSPQPPLSRLDKKAATWCNEYVLQHADEIWAGDISEGGMLNALLKAHCLGRNSEVK